MPATAATATDSKTDFRISRFTAEFVDSDTELVFRAACHDSVVRDTRFAFGFGVLISLLLAVSDYLALGPGEEFSTLFNGRIVIGVVALVVVWSAAHYWRSLMDGVTPTLVEFVALIGFLSMTLLRPYEPGWHGMSMMLLLLGIYIFVPNRFLPALGLALGSTLIFVYLMNAHFQFSAREFLNLGVLFSATNLFGARAAYRKSRRMREEFVDAECRRHIQLELDRERELRARLQAERDVLAQSDVLTGAANLRHFLDLIEDAIHAGPGADRSTSPQPVSLLVLDVDYFKQINDTYGHHHSESVLKHVVSVCQHVLRRSDSLARLGEASFAALLHDTDIRSGRQLAERLCAELHRVPLRLPEASVYVSVSVGLAQWCAGETTAAFMRRADAALALARAKGSNRVELAADPIALRELERTAGRAQNDSPDPLQERP